MDEIDRGVGLEQVAPDAQARIGLAGDDQHAQAVAHAADLEGGAVVQGGELARAGGGLDLDHRVAGLVQGEGDLGQLAGGDGELAHDLAVLTDGDRHAGCGGGLAGNVVDAQLDHLRLADHAEAGRLQDGELAVALLGPAGEQHVQGCRQVEGGRVGGRVVGLAVGQRHHRTQPRAVALGQPLLEPGEQAAALAALAVERQLAQLDAGHPLDPLAQRGLGLGQLGRAVGQALAGRAVAEHQDEIVEGCALLAAQDRVGEKQEEESQEGGAPGGAARPAPEGQSHHEDGGCGQEPDQPPGQMRGEDEAGGAHWPRRSSSAGTWTWSVL